MTHKLAAKLQTRITAVLNERREGGQGAVEYLGVIVVAVAIILAIMQTNVGTTIAEAITKQVEKVTS